MEDIKQINKVVRLGDIKSIEKEGNIANYERIEVSSIDISKKADNAKRLKELLKQTLSSIIEEYQQLSYEDEKNIDKKVDLLVDIEEIVKTIGRMDNKSWEIIWHNGRLGSMQGFARYARVGKPNLQGCVLEYLTYNDFDDLCYIETALFDELRKMKQDYIKFQDKRKRKEKSKGGFREGYYLKSIEYVDNQQYNK